MIVFKGIEIKNPVEYLPDFCKEIQYEEICDGDLYVLTFQKPQNKKWPSPKDWVCG
jgi:hypothetical protein